LGFKQGDFSLIYEKNHGLYTQVKTIAGNRALSREPFFCFVMSCFEWFEIVLRLTNYL